MTGTGAGDGTRTGDEDGAGAGFLITGIGYFTWFWFDVFIVVLVFTGALESTFFCSTFEVGCTCCDGEGFIGFGWTGTRTGLLYAIYPFYGWSVS